MEENKKGVGLRQLGWSLAGTPVSEPWAAMANWVRGRPKYPEMKKMSSPRPLDLSPDYQRGSVWDEARQRAFIGHLLEGGNCPNLYIARDDSGCTVVDGKQRLLAITAFIEGVIPGDVTLNNGDTVSLWYHDFDEQDRNCSQMDLPIVYGRWTREEQIRFYLRLNSGGVAHTPAELAKARELWLAAKAGKK